MIGINGLGRIGKLALRSLHAQDQLHKVGGINDPTDNKVLAHLLKYDTTQGEFDAEVDYDDGHIIIDGVKIPTTSEREPSKLAWEELLSLIHI